MDEICCDNSNLIIMLRFGQQASENQSIILNTITLVMIVAIAFLLKRQASQIGQTNRKHTAMLMGMKEKYLDLQSEFANNTSKFGEFDKMIMMTIASEQQKIEKMLKLIEQKIRVSLQKPEYDRPLYQLSYEERLNRVERYIADHAILIDLIENQMKENIKEERAKKFKELSEKNVYFKDSVRRNYWLMEQANLKTAFTTEYQLKKMEELFQTQQSRLEEVYHLSKYTTELPFCIIIPSYKNAKDFRFEFNLQSILNQQYQNYHVIIIDDASSDRTGFLIERFLRKNRISDQKVKLVINQKRVTAVPNIHYAIMNHCKPDEIGFFVDGDDEMISRKALQIFNAVYQEKKPSIAYSIALEYWIMNDLVKDGWSLPYTHEEKANNMYRDVPQKISHLRSFRIDLYRQIKERDLKDQNGEWFTSTYDEVICLPMLQMSCGNIEFIPEYLYLYTFGTGLNDRQVDEKLQWNIAQYVKFKMPKYQCNPKFGTPLPPVPPKTAQNSKDKADQQAKDKNKEKDEKVAKTKLESNLKSQAKLPTAN